MRVFAEPDTLLPEVHLLSNGRYHVMATHAGGSYSRWGGLAVTRWREDVTCDGWGTFIYLRDGETGNYWSTGYQPTCRRGDYYEAIFVQGRAEYRRRDRGIEAYTEVCVSPEDDVEIRRVTLTNQSTRTRRIEVTSYAEVVLAPLNADLAHRTFSNLFVQTEILPGQRAILCTRRPRAPDEQVPWMFHLLAAPGAVADTREAVIALLEKYCDRHFAERAFELAWFQSQEVLRHLNATESDAQLFGRLANSVVYGHALRRTAPSVMARNQLGQTGLWRFAISGDLPVVLLLIGDVSRMDLVKQVLQAHAYWRMKGLAVDLVIINEGYSGYRAVLHDLIMGLINVGADAQVIDKPGGVFVRRAEELSEDERVLLQTVSRPMAASTL